MIDIDQLSVFSLKDKNIIITGASSGIGRACAITCSKAGARLLLIARDKGRVEETMTMLYGKGHSYFLLDLSNVEDIFPVMNVNIKDFLPIHGLIHCAGVENTVPLQALNQDRYLELFKINTIAGFELARCISRKTNYDSKAGASLIFLSSIMSMLGQEGKIAYSASKGAIVAGVRSLALELAKRSIRANAISPAMVETEMLSKMFEALPPESVDMIKGMHPLGFGKPEDIANACVFLLSDAARWITGTNLIIDGGYSAK